MNIRNLFSKAVKLYNNIGEDYLGLVAAGVAFYFLMAAFPALAAAISLYGIFSDPHFVSDQINQLSRFLPKEAVDIFAGQADSLLKAGSGTLGISLLISTFIAIYSSTKGVGALIKGLNIAYNEKETRGFVRLTLTGFILTAGLLVYLLLALSLIAGMPAVLNIIHMPEVTFDLYLLMRWPLLFLTAVLGLEILYSYAPCHQRMQWHWVSWGSFLGTVIWLLMSSFFSLFVTHFGKYNETYGSLSAIVILLSWFWFSAMIILTGAEINHVFAPAPVQGQEKKLSLKAGSEAQVEEAKV